LYGVVQRKLNGLKDKYQVEITTDMDEIINSMYIDIVNIWSSSMMSDSHPFTVGYEAVFDNAVIRYYEDSYTEDKVDTKLMVFTDDVSRK